ncbi:MAG: hypothetical protein ACRC35_00200 [Angustibacter sp.]
MAPVLPAVARVWRRLPPQQQDAALATVAASLAVLTMLAEPVNALRAVGRPADVGGVVLALGTTVPLAWRRRHPLLVVGVTTAALAVAAGFDYAAEVGALATAFAAGSAAFHTDRRVSRWLAVGGALLLTTEIATTTSLTPMGLVSEVAAGDAAGVDR